MPLSPITQSPRNASALVLGASVVLVGAGFLLGRALQPATTIVHVQQCDCAPTQPTQTPTQPTQPVIAIDSLPSITWASKVREFSSQYSADSWSAQQVLGAPNVYPQHGDIDQAWASLTADGQDEYIEVEFPRAQRISAVEIYETYNPGAISSIELITVRGTRLAAPSAKVESLEQLSNDSEASDPASQRSIVDLGCTDEPILAVRIRLSSVKVSGWNELDAIGVAPCAEQ